MMQNVAAVIRPLDQRVVHQVVQFMAVGAQLNRHPVLAMRGKIPQVMTMRRGIATGCARGHPLLARRSATLLAFTIFLESIKVQPIRQNLVPFARFRMRLEYGVEGRDDFFRLFFTIQAANQCGQFFVLLPFRRRGFNPGRSIFERSRYSTISSPASNFSSSFSASIYFFFILS